MLDSVAVYIKTLLFLDMELQQTPGEQELAEEKKKNLSILQSVLNVSIQPSDASKEATKGKIFKYEFLCNFSLLYTTLDK